VARILARNLMSPGVPKQDQSPAARPGVPAPPPDRLLDIEGLVLEFDEVRALDGVSLHIDQGESLALVGESGSGKSVTALSVARLLASPPARYPAGRIRVLQQDVLTMSRRDLRRIRGGVVSYVFQEPGVSLNPVMTVERQIREALRLHRPEEDGEAAVVELLERVGIPAPRQRMRDYPHQLSGGMQQRVMIAMALAPRPALLIADEPTTALDVTIQAQIMDLLASLRTETGMSILLITHNLGLVGDLADRVAVMYAGQIVETGPACDILHAPAHPYTRALLESVPRLGQGTERLRAIPGTPPRPGAFPSGCRFHPRCPIRQTGCDRVSPGWLALGEERHVRCPHWNQPHGA